MIFIPHPAGITTLRRLRTPDCLPPADELQRLSAQRPVTLLLPCHSRDLGTESLARIVAELAETPWISRFIVGLDGLEEPELPAARQCFAGLGERVTFLWTGAPAVAQLEARLRAASETTAESGKGRNVWLCAGLALALDGEAPAPGRVVALHDCDIRDYSRELITRLCLPLLRADFGFRFVKGFYSRHSDRLHGRLMRLLLRPLLQAMELRAGPLPGLQFLSAFQYPLAGETAVEAGVLRRLALPAGWGLEIGLLDQARRILTPPQFCQSALCAAYDHKHQELSPDDPGAGLHRMAREVAATLMGTVSGGSYPWQDEIFVTWQARAAEALRQAEAESFLNGLDFDPAQERLAVQTFGRALENALEQPVAPKLLPSWDGVEEACPGVSGLLLQAADFSGKSE